MEDLSYSLIGSICSYLSGQDLRKIMWLSKRVARYVMTAADVILPRYPGAVKVLQRLADLKSSTALNPAIGRLYHRYGTVIAGYLILLPVPLELDRSSVNKWLIYCLLTVIEGITSDQYDVTGAPGPKNPLCTVTGLATTINPNRYGWIFIGNHICGNPVGRTIIVSPKEARRQVIYYGDDCRYTLDCLESNHLIIEQPFTVGRSLYNLQSHTYTLTRQSMRITMLTSNKRRVHAKVFVKSVGTFRSMEGRTVSQTGTWTWYLDDVLDVVFEGTTISNDLGVVHLPTIQYGCIYVGTWTYHREQPFCPGVASITGTIHIGHMVDGGETRYTDGRVYVGAYESIGMPSQGTVTYPDGSRRTEWPEE